MRWDLGQSCKTNFRRDSNVRKCTHARTHAVTGGMEGERTWLEWRSACVLDIRDAGGFSARFRAPMQLDTEVENGMAVYGAKKGGRRARVCMAFNVRVSEFAVLVREQ
jgi:hypothetical protein